LEGAAEGVEYQTEDLEGDDAEQRFRVARQYGSSAVSLKPCGRLPVHGQRRAAPLVAAIAQTLASTVAIIAIATKL